MAPPFSQVLCLFPKLTRRWLRARPPIRRPPKDAHLRYADRIYYYCKRRLREDDLVRDATSTIMLKAFEGLYQKSIHHVQSWFFSVAHNEIKQDRNRRGTT